MLKAPSLKTSKVIGSGSLAFNDSERPSQTYHSNNEVSDDIGYVVYSALGSFYIPSCIMVFVYIRIYFAAKARARRGIRKNPRPRPVVTSAQVQKNPLASCPLRSSTLSVNGELQLQQTRGRAPSVAIDADMVSEMEPSSSDSGVVSRCGGVKPLKLRIFKKTDRRQEKSQPSKSELEPALPKPHKPRDPEREKKRLARKKEKRATLILGLIMGSFIACWLPFFFLYILKAACRNCVIPSSAFAIAFWLGYMNSVLNPVIYTIFNKDFRRAFRRILFK
ncbi:unnamed protein product [Spodoptera littoralis]|uniref:G-protein coupled receptors family 1 profile domain-containing protein n=1 Tax=Spodoptera littoralis TaxID=7109 RepID=A0A9P0I720_SPOLI|nr:unnamed protein product [Spodoptera littoralis]CAH1641388.1 unnamed protein product [Spodoptera littoralis]